MTPHGHQSDIRRLYEALPLARQGQAALVDLLRTPLATANLERLSHERYGVLDCIGVPLFPSWGILKISYIAPTSSERQCPDIV